MQICSKRKFEEIFFAGQPTPSISNKLSLDTLNSNIIPVFNILLTIYNFDLKSKFFNACSCEILGLTKIECMRKQLKNQCPFTVK